MTTRIPRPRCRIRRACHGAVLDAGVYYINVASQILFYAIFALGTECAGGLRRAGFARSCRIFSAWPPTRPATCCSSVSATRLAILVALVIGVASMAIFAALSLRSTGIGFIMITLALGEILWGLAYRWISLTGGDNGLSLKSRPRAVRLFDVRCEYILLCEPCYFPAVACGGDGVRALAARRRTDGHARPAAPHERARLSRLGDPFLRLHVFRSADLDIRHSVRLLHAVHQSADAGADCLGRGAADGDLRRCRNTARADCRRRIGRCGQDCGERIHRAMEFPARRHFRRYRHPDARRSGAWHCAPVAAGVAQT